MVVLVLAACSASGPEGRLLAVSEAGGKPATVLVGADGSGARPLAGLGGAVYPGPADPRGTHALVVTVRGDSEDSHREQLWLAPLDGGNPVALTGPSGRVRNPSWSPDGSWVAFESDADSYRDLYRVQRDGSGLKRLTNAEHGSFEPAVSPDGRSIAMGTSRDGRAEVYVMLADGDGQTRLTHKRTDDVHPVWSPDGETLSWIAWRDGTPRVWLMTPHGGNQRPLRPLEPDEVDQDMVWSPDGTRIAVVTRLAPSNVGIEIVDVATGSVTATLDGPGSDEFPTWSPDGRWIAWGATVDGEAMVVVARPDGSKRRTVTRGWLPRWLPEPGHGGGS